MLDEKENLENENQENENPENENAETQNSENENSENENSENENQSESDNKAINISKEKNTSEKSQDTAPSSADSDNDDENKKENKKHIIIIVEILIALIAIGFIIFAITTKNKEKNANSSSSNDASSMSASSNVSGQSISLADIDNSALYENLPEIPDVVSLNTITEEEAQKLVEENKFLKLQTKDGVDVYLPNYENSEYLHSEVSCDDAQIDAEIFEKILSKHLQDAPADKTVAELYDTVDIDYSGKIDGVVFEGGTAQGQSLSLGSHSFIEGFEEGVVGMKVGETKDITTKFPENYPNSPDLAGKEAIFTVTLNKIVKECPEFTDEIAAEEDSEYNTVEKTREKMRNDIIKQKLDMFLMSSYYVTGVNKDSVLNYYNSSMDYYAQMLSSQAQMSVADMLAQQGLNIEDFKKDAIKASAFSAMSIEVYTAITDSNNLTITDEKKNKLAKELKVNSIDELYTQFGEQTINDYLISDIALDFILESF